MDLLASTAAGVEGLIMFMKRLSYIISPFLIDKPLGTP